jgi:predicted enzyme related to lactoylglutathione lyase
MAYFKGICIDAGDPARVGPFWATVLGLTWDVRDGGDGWLTGPTPQHTIWINGVPEPKRVKNRVHLDVYAQSLADLEARGARVLRPAGEGRRFSVMADPAGAEFCAFLRADPPPQRLHGLVVDSADPAAIARWWGDVFGQPVDDNGGVGAFTVVSPSGAPFTMDFVQVPEPKTVKNRVHWDVTAADPELLLDAGATLLRAPDEDISWHVLADPQGNEFCAFPPSEPAL